MGMAIEVASRFIVALLEEAKKSGDQECCGLLLGSGERMDRVQPAENVADDPARRFEIDPAALLAAHKAARQGGPDLIGYYHSHPDGHPLPSATDCEHSSGDGRLWAIIAAGEVTFWRDEEQGFVPADIAFAD